MSINPILNDPKKLSTFKFKEYKGKFMGYVKKLAKKSTSQDTRVPFILELNQNFQDGATELLLVFGKLKEWKKASPKYGDTPTSARGYCFVTPDAKTGAAVINLMVTKGKVKETAVAKALKSVVNISKCSIAFVEGTFEDNDAYDAAIDAAVDDTGDVEEDAEAEEAASIDPKYNALAQKAARELNKLSAEAEAVNDSAGYDAVLKKFKPLYSAWEQVNLMAKRPEDEAKLVADTKDALKNAAIHIRLNTIEQLIKKYRTIDKKEELPAAEQAIEKLFAATAPQDALADA